MKRLIGITIISLIYILFLIGMAGCRSVKKSQSSEVLITDSSIVEKQTLVKTEKENNFTRETSDIIFHPVKVITDTAIIKEECPENRVIYRTNGDVEVSGNIGAFNYEKTKLVSKNDSLSKELEREKKNVRVETKTETVVKRKAVLWLLWLMIPAFLFGLYLGVNYRSKFKVEDAGSEAEAIYNRIKEQKLRDLK